LVDLTVEFPNSKNWVSGFALMAIFVNQPPKEKRPFALQFVRRIEMAIAEYARMRAEVQDLLYGPRWSPYYRALHHGEVAAAMLYQAYDLTRKKLKLPNNFEPGDGSALQRLNCIYNASKHVAADTQDPVWLSNFGIHTAEGNLLYSEFEDLARSLARIAEQITSTNGEHSAQSQA
jgi:hypothetical protein